MSSAACIAHACDTVGRLLGHENRYPNPLEPLVEQYDPDHPFFEPFGEYVGE